MRQYPCFPKSIRPIIRHSDWGHPNRFYAASTPRVVPVPVKNGSCRHTAAISPRKTASAPLAATACMAVVIGPFPRLQKTATGHCHIVSPAETAGRNRFRTTAVFRNIRLYNSCIIPVPYSRDIHSRHHRPNSSDSEINNTSRAGPRQPTAAHWRPKTRRYGKNGASATPRPISPGQSYSKVRHRQPCGHLPQA